MSVRPISSFRGRQGPTGTDLRAYVARIIYTESVGGTRRTFHHEIAVQASSECEACELMIAYFEETALDSEMGYVRTLNELEVLRASPAEAAVIRRPELIPYEPYFRLNTPSRDAERTTRSRATPKRRWSDARPSPATAEPEKVDGSRDATMRYRRTESLVATLARVSDLIVSANDSADRTRDLANLQELQRVVKRLDEDGVVFLLDLG